MHYYSIAPTKNKTFNHKNWVFEINDPKTGIKFLVEYKSRRFIIFDIEHPNVISGVAVYYKDKLIEADIVFKHYENKYWFGEIIERLMPILMRKTIQKVQSFDKIKIAEFYEQERRKM